MATALLSRLNEAIRALLDDPACNMGKPRARLEQLEHEIADRRLALLQIVRALEAEQPKAREVVRRPRPVEVSTYEVVT